MKELPRFDEITSDIVSPSGNELEQSAKEIAPHRMDDVAAQTYIAERVDLHALAQELGPASIFTKHEGGAMEVLARLVVELKDRIPNYDTILSDDASGRLVSLLLRHIVQGKRDKAKEPLQTYFLAAGRDSTDDIKAKIDEFIVERKEKLGKVLLVTEYIGTGKTINFLVNTLEKHNVDFDLAAVSIRRSADFYEKGIQRHLFYGGRGEEGAYFYGKPKFAGVRRTLDLELGVDRLIHPIPVRDDGDDFSETIVQVREDLKVVGEELKKLV